jgi:hypothetical protein
MSQRLTIYTNPRRQAISDAIMLARLAYDGKLAVNLTKEDNRSGLGNRTRDTVHVREEGGPRRNCASRRRKSWTLRVFRNCIRSLKDIAQAVSFIQG